MYVGKHKITTIIIQRKTVGVALTIICAFKRAAVHNIKRDFGKFTFKNLFFIMYFANARHEYFA